MNVRTTIAFSSLALTYLTTLPLPLSTFWVMTTYYGAQYCLTMGLIDAFLKKEHRQEEKGQA